MNEAGTKPTVFQQLKQFASEAAQEGCSVEAIYEHALGRAYDEGATISDQERARFLDWCCNLETLEQ